MMKLHRFISVVWWAALLSACSSDSKEMLTVVNADGSCYREFYAQADSAFVLGAKAPACNPFPVVPTAGDELTWSYGRWLNRTDFPLSKSVYDSLFSLHGQRVDTVGVGAEHVVVRLRQHFRSVEQLDSEFRFKEKNPWSRFKPTHRLQKQFRWFYTYYRYSERYPKLRIPTEVPIGKYLTQDEWHYWFTGQPDLLKGMNGMEARDYLGRIENKYERWLNHCVWNLEYKVVVAHYGELENPPVPLAEFRLLRDSILATAPTDVLDKGAEKVLDTFFRTKVFTRFWEGVNDSVRGYKEIESFVYLFYADPGIRYRLVLPGVVVDKGTALVQGDTLEWRLSPLRFVGNDYVLTAQSRRANVWAFALTALPVLVFLATFIVKPRRRYRRM